MLINSVVKVFFVTEKELATHPKKAILESLQFTGTYPEVLFLPESSQIFVGISYKQVSKSSDPFARILPFDLGAKIFATISKTTITRLEIQKADFLISKKDDLNNNLLQLMLGILQASLNFDKYLQPKKIKTRKMEISVAPELQIYINSKFEKLLTSLNESQTLTRNLINDTPEAINPKTYPQIIKQELEKYSNVDLKILDSQKLQEMGMNGILFVGRASRFQPVLVHATLKPQGKVKQKICLVGKGLTYDSGGLDIKTEGHMMTMKSDMGGSATMFGVFKALAEIGLENTEIHFLTALAENMVDGNSYKADDILTTYSGQTVEIRNTDAEGRLTLADVLAYTTLLDPNYIIDVATLTGACIVAVSDYYTSLMSNDKQMSSELQATFESEGELTVHNQLPEVLRQAVSSELADLNNTSNLNRMAGHLTAGLFLSHFVDQTLFRNEKLKIDSPKAYPWVHLDIAGSGFNNMRNSLGVNGATGQSVRSLVKWTLQKDNDLS